MADLGSRQAVTDIMGRLWPDNTSRQISPLDARSVIQDLLDTLVAEIDAAGGNAPAAWPAGALPNAKIPRTVVTEAYHSQLLGDLPFPREAAFADQTITTANGYFVAVPGSIPSHPDHLAVEITIGSTAYWIMLSRAELLALQSIGSVPTRPSNANGVSLVLSDTRTISVGHSDGGGLAFADTLDETLRVTGYPLRPVPAAPAAWATQYRTILADGGLTAVLNSDGNYVIHGGGSSGGGGANPPVRVHTGYLAARTDRAFAAADFTGGVSSEVGTFRTPAFAAPSYLAFAIPDTEADLTTITVRGDPFNQNFLSSAVNGYFVKQPNTVQVNAAAYKIYITSIPLVAAYGVNRPVWQIH